MYTCVITQDMHTHALQYMEPRFSPWSQPLPYMGSRPNEWNGGGGGEDGASDDGVEGKCGSLEDEAGECKMWMIMVGWLCAGLDKCGDVLEKQILCVWIAVLNIINVYILNFC